MVQKAGLKSFANTSMSAMDLMPGNPYTPPSSNIGVNQLNTSAADIALAGDLLVPEIDLNQFEMPETQQQAPGPQVKYSPSQDKIFANGLLFDTDDFQSAVDSKKYILEGQPMAPPPGDWIDIQPDFYAQYLDSIEDPGRFSLFRKNLSIGVQNLKYLGGSALQAVSPKDSAVFKFGEGVRDKSIEKLYKLQPFQREFTNIKLGDPENKSEGALDWFVAVVGQQVPNLLESMALVLAGVVVGGPIGAGTALTAKTIGKSATKKLIMSGIKKRQKGEILSKAEKKAMEDAAGVLAGIAKHSPQTFKKFSQDGLLKNYDEILDNIVALGRVRGQKIGGATGMFGSAYVMGVGDIYAELLETGAEGDELDKKLGALTGALPYAALESLTTYFLATRLFLGRGTDKAFDIPTKRILGSKIAESDGFFLRAAKQGGYISAGALAGGTAEGVTEIGQETINVLSAKILNGHEYMDGEVLNRLINAGAAGFAVGSTLGGLGNLRRGQPTDLLQKEPEQEQEQEQETLLLTGPEQEEQPTEFMPEGFPGGIRSRTLAETGGAVGPTVSPTPLEGEILGPDGTVVPRGVDPQIYDDVEGTATEVIPPRQIGQDRLRLRSPQETQGELFGGQDLGTPPPQGQVNLQRGTGPQRLIGVNQRPQFDPAFGNVPPIAVDWQAFRYALPNVLEPGGPVATDETLTKILDDPNQEAANALNEDFLNQQQAPKKFKTSKGSTYNIDNQGRTKRTKKVGEGAGIQGRSDKTYYVSPADAQTLQATLKTSKVKLFPDRIELDVGDGQIISVPSNPNPAVGLHPVEFRKDRRSPHIGNVITEFIEDKKETLKKKGKKKDAVRKSSTEKVSLRKQTKSSETTRTKNTKEISTTKKTKEEILRKGLLGDVTDTTRKTITTGDLKLRRVSKTIQKSKLTPAIYTKWDNALKAAGGSIEQMPVQKVSEKEYQRLEIVETREDGSTVYNVYTYADENAKTISAFRNTTEKKIDRSRKVNAPTNAPGKSEQEAYNNVRQDHWLPWKLINSDLKKLFKIKFIANSLSRLEISRLYHNYLEEADVTTANILFKHMIADLDLEMAQQEVTTTFEETLDNIVKIAWFNGAEVGNKAIPSYDASKKQSLYQTTVGNTNIKPEHQGNNAREIAQDWLAANKKHMSDEQLEILHLLVLERQRVKSSFDVDDKGQFPITVKLENGNLPPWLVHLKSYKLLADLTAGDSTYYFKGLEQSNLTQEEINEYNDELNKEAHFFKRSTIDYQQLQRNAKAAKKREEEKFRSTLDKKQLELLDDIDKSFADWGMSLPAVTRQNLAKSNSTHVSQRIATMFDSMLNLDSNVVIRAANKGRIGGYTRKDNRGEYKELIPYVPNKGTDYKTIIGAIERLYKHADKKYKYNGVPLEEYFSPEGKLYMRWKVVLKRQHGQDRLFVYYLPRPPRLKIERVLSKDGKKLVGYKDSYRPYRPKTSMSPSSQLKEVNKLLAFYEQKGAQQTAEEIDEKIKTAKIKEVAETLFNHGWASEQAKIATGQLQEDLYDLDSANDVGLDSVEEQQQQIDIDDYKDGSFKRIEDDKPAGRIGLNRVKLIVKQILRKFKVKPKVSVFKNLNDLRYSNPELYAQAKASRIEGDFDTTAERAYAFAFGDNIIVFSDTIHSTRQLKFVLAHEILGHFGFRSILSKGEIKSVLEDIYNKDRFIRAKVEEYMVVHGVSKLEAIEEVIADYAASLDTSLLKRIWNKIKTALNKILGIKFGDEYARTLINQINRYVRHGQMSSDVSMLSMADNLNRLNKEAELRFATDDAATVQSQVGQAQMHGRTSIDNRDIYGKAIEQAGGIAKVWEFIKRKLSTLDNLALYSEGLQKVFTISQKQGTFSNMLLSRYEEMTNFVRNIVGGPNAKERQIANMMLAYASMYRKYEFDKIVAKLLEGKSGIERYNLIRFFVVDPVTGDVVPNKAFQDRIKKLGRMTPEDFKKGFNIPFGGRDNPVPVSIHKQMLKSGIDLKTFDPDNNPSYKKIWTMFTEHNSAVTEASIDLVESNYFAFENEKSDLIDRLDVFTDATDHKIMKRIIDTYNTLMMQNAIKKDGETVEVNTKSFRKAEDFLVAITRALWQTGAVKDWNDLANGTYNYTPEQIAAIIKKDGGFTDLSQFSDMVTGKKDVPQILDIIQSLSRLRQKGLSKDDVKIKVQATIRDLGSELLVLKNSELKAMNTIIGNYAPLIRKGAWEVRLQAFSGNTPIQLDKKFKSYLPYFLVDTKAEADARVAELEKIFSETYDLEGSSITFRAIASEARQLSPLEGSIDFVAFVRTLKNMGINLTPTERHTVAMNLSKASAAARKALRRENVEGFDENIMGNIADHLETQARISAKNRYRYKMVDIMLDDKLWNGDPDKLDLLGRMVNSAANESDRLIKLREYERYLFQFVTMANDYRKSGTYTDINGRKHTLKARGNTFRDEAVRYQAFWDSQTDIVHSTEDLISQQAGWLKTMTVMFQLGGNIATAAINLMSMVTHAIPYLAFKTKHGYGGGHHLGRASFNMSKAALDVGLPRFADIISLKKIQESPAEQRKYNLTQDEINFIVAQTRNGTLQAAQFNALVGSSKSGIGKDTLGVPGAIKIKGVKGWMSFFSYTEQLNRRVTALASYRMEKERMLAGAKNNTERQEIERQLLEANTDNNPFKARLYAEAQMAVNKSQGEYGMYNRPEVARGNWLQYAFMYKQFLMISVNLMKHMDYRGKLMFLGILLLVSGIKGIPFADDIMDLIDTLIQRFNIPIASVEGELIKILEDLPKEFAGINIPGAIMRGIVDQGLGGTVSTRLGFGDLVPFTGILKKGLKGEDYRREIKNGFGPVFSAGADSIGTILNMGSYGLEKVGLKDDTTYFSSIVKGSPVAGLRNVAESYSYYKDGMITNKSGKVISKDMNTMQWATRLLGLYPTVATRHNDIVRVSKYANAYIRTQKSYYTQAYVSAMVKGNRREARRVLGMVRDWNRENRGTEFEFKNFLRSANKSLKEAKFPTLSRYVRTTPLQTRSYTEKLAMIMGMDLD